MDKDNPKNNKIWIPIEANLESVTKRVEMGIDGCVKLFEISLGTKLLVQTKNHNYILEKIGEREYFISGHSILCPNSIRVIVSGSTFGSSSFLWMDRLGWGMLMEFRLLDDSLVIRTSPIVDMKILIISNNQL